MNDPNPPHTPQGQLREINEALLISSIRQQELAEAAQKSESDLRESNSRLRKQSDELRRFNHVAVGRESRIIELKAEVNDLRRQHGEDAKYRVDFEPKTTPVAPAPPIPFPQEAPVPLESILCTAELERRTSRAADYAAENRALGMLVQALADSPRTILQKLADIMLEQLRVGSAGISLLARDGKRFFWPAIAGEWRLHIGGGTPREFGPCGDVLDRNAPLLFKNIERRYAYFSAVSPPVEEALLVPFYVAGEAVGTIWAVAHDVRRRFDNEDLRQLESLARFASAAYQAVDTLDGLEQGRDASLNLMEDAVQSRMAVEKLNRELNESETRFRALFEAAPMAVSVCDADLVIQQYNARAVELWGREPVGGVDPHFFSTNSRSPSGTELTLGESPIHEVLRTGVAIHGVELSIERPDESRIPVLADFAPLNGEQRQIIGTITSFIDISERSRLEQTTREQAQQLVELHRRKDEFLAMLGHELRNPLAAIHNATDLLGYQEREGELQQRARHIIERQVTQLTHLVNDLMEVSRITTGKIQLRRGRVAVNGIVERTVETVRPLIEQRRQDLSVSLSVEPIWLMADAARLEQVIVNLLTNAAKYTDIGGRISIAVERDAEECLVRVKDNGAGIAPDLLPRVFYLFTQADQSLDRSQGGLGIGLALVRRLVDLHGGRVEVHSSLGEGSEFVVHLPIPDLASASLTREIAAAPPGHAQRVTLVDDNRDAATALSMLLKAAGHEVLTIYEGSSALQAILKFRPTVIFMDIGLPGIDGYEVAKLIRQQPALEHTILVALTGHGSEADRRRSKEAGFDDHLVKPATFSKIKDILATVANQA